MFVGDVRWATTGTGSSWKLSGGRPWSSGPTNVSKNRQVRRAVRRSAAVSSAVSRSAAASGAGRLTRWATKGAEQPQDDEGRRQRACARLRHEDEDGRDGRDGDATRHLPVERRQPGIVAGLGVRGRRPLQQLAVRHVQPGQRPQDRVGHQPGLVRAGRRGPGLRGPRPGTRPRPRPAGGCAWRSPAGAVAARPGLAGPGGRSSPRGRSRSRSRPAPRAASRPRASVASPSGADSVRRRLSIIFQRAIPGIEPRERRPAASRALPRIQGSSCQSPRAQRCCRAAETR